MSKKNTNNSIRLKEMDRKQQQQEQQQQTIISHPLETDDSSSSTSEESQRQIENLHTISEEKKTIITTTIFSKKKVNDVVNSSNNNNNNIESISVISSNNSTNSNNVDSKKSENNTNTINTSVENKSTLQNTIKNGLLWLQNLVIRISIRFFSCCDKEFLFQKFQSLLISTMVLILLFLHRVKQWSCCWPLFAIVILGSYTSLFSTSSKYSISETMPIPLASHIMKIKCYQVDVNNTNLANQVYSNKTFHHYIKSLQYHTERENVTGLTLYHIGLPQCVIFMRDELGINRVFYNPIITSFSTLLYDIGQESDILCPNKISARKKRFLNIDVDYDEIKEIDFKLCDNDNADSTIDRTQTTNVNKKQPFSIRIRARLTNSDSIVFQHLYDTLEGKNVCNEQ